MSITMSPEYLGCPEGDCDSGEFWLLPDGRIMCADGECYAVFGYWTRPGFDPDGDAPEGTR